jgi:predicted nucleic acid-binding protein
MKMSDDQTRIFLDTNVLVYATQATAPENQLTRQKLQELEAFEPEFWISRQVLREYISTVSRPQTYANPLSMDTIAKRVRLFEQIFRVADDTAEVTANLLNLITEYPTGGKQVHDANIVATMLTYGIGSLLTGNIGDLKRFEDRITLIPLIGDA